MNNSNQNTTTLNNNGDATRMFMTHVKEMLLSLPPFSVFALIVPYVIYLLDNILLLVYSQSISQWCYLSVDKVLNDLQVQRLVLYPLGSTSFAKLLITTIWLLPELYKLEKRHGTIKVAWLTLLLYTLLPGLGYVILVTVISFSMPTYDQGLKDVVYAGMTGWVVALIFWSYLEDDRNGSSGNRMLPGSIRIPNKVMPMLALLFFIFLVPDSSFLLNLISAVIGYLCKFVANALISLTNEIDVYEKLPKILTLSDESFARFEKKPWLSPLISTPNYVPVNEHGVYLPIANSNSTSFVNTSYSNNNNNNNSNNNTATSPGSFPGQGYRLGSS
ncbi:hypothetical protein RMATCC62417_03896 [Rhizopus microsporus]|nr:hypothetical protein RMATCC62417_03896 [Rhizopus microsporus]